MSGGGERAGYKRTEVGVIPEEWEESQLGEQIREPIRNGYSPVCPSHPTGRWMLSLSAVSPNGFDPSGVKPAPENDPKVLENLLQDGDIVISRSNTPDRVGLAGIYRGDPSPCAYPDLLMRVRPRSSLNPEFLLYRLLSYSGRRFFSDHARGSSGSMVKIDRTILKSFPVLLPPVIEQRAIAATLSDADALISGLDQLIAKKRDLKQAAMQQLLTGQRRLPGFKDAWQSQPLKSIIREFIVPMRDKPKEFSGNIPWCRIEDFDGKYLFSSKSNQCVNNDIIQKMNLKIFPVGTLLVSCSANLGRCAIVGLPLVSNKTFIGLVPDEKLSTSEFLFYLMTFNASKLNLLSAGTTISYLSREQFESFEVIVPPSFDEQVEIAQVLSDMDTEIAALESRRDKTRDLKQGMMHELLTGRIRLV